MTGLLEEVYRYRAIRGRCEAGSEVTMEEIQELEAVERELTQTTIEMPALLRTRRFCDPIRVVGIGPTGFVLAGSPWVEVDDIVEIAVDTDDASYRFKGRVTWLAEDPHGDLDVSLAFVGVPLLLRRGPRSTNPHRPLTDTLDQIAA